jgi:hypothetical protein
MVSALPYRMDFLWHFCHVAGFLAQNPTFLDTSCVRRMTLDPQLCVQHQVVLRWVVCAHEQVSVILKLCLLRLHQGLVVFCIFFWCVEGCEPDSGILQEVWAEGSCGWRVLTCCLRLSSCSATGKWKSIAFPDLVMITVSCTEMDRKSFGKNTEGTKTLPGPLGPIVSVFLLQTSL